MIGWTMGYKYDKFTKIDKIIWDHKQTIFYIFHVQNVSLVLNLYVVECMSRNTIMSVLHKAICCKMINNFGIYRLIFTFWSNGFIFLNNFERIILCCSNPRNPLNSLWTGFQIKIWIGFNFPLDVINFTTYVWNIEHLCSLCVGRRRIIESKLWINTNRQQRTDTDTSMDG